MEKFAIIGNITDEKKYFKILPFHWKYLKCKVGISEIFVLFWEYFEFKANIFILVLH